MRSDRACIGWCAMTFKPEVDRLSKCGLCRYAIYVTLYVSTTIMLAVISPFVVLRMTVGHVSQEIFIYW